MKILRDKTTAATIAFILLLTMAATFITCLPAAKATVYPAKETYAFVAIAPNPIGVGQSALVTMWISDFTPSYLYGFEPYYITVTKPGGATETLGPFKSESTGSTYTHYVPATVGTYSFQMTFNGMWLNYTIYDFFGNPIDTSEQYYKPSTSLKANLTVQQEPITWLPGTPVTTDYWERPIYGENQEWNAIAGNFLNPAGGQDAGGFGLGFRNLYTSGPESPHIMWTREIDFGGIVGGADSRGYYTGLSYERKFAGITIQGRLYYNLYPSGFGGAYPPGFACVDLRTGEELWRNEEGLISFGQVFRFESGNQHGNTAYLWYAGFTGYTMYHAFSGVKILDINNVPSGTRATGPDGEILIFSLSGTDPATGKRTLSMWNSSRVEGMISVMFGTPMLRPSYGATLNGTTGIQWTKNVSSVPLDPGIYWLDYDKSTVVCKAQQTLPTEVAVHCAYDLKTGALLWTQNYTGLIARVNFVNEGPIGEGVYAEYTKENLKWVGFNARTGVKLWETDPSPNAWGSYISCSAIAYGKLYTAGYDGYVHAYNLTTGKEVFKYFSGSSGYETPYGHYPFMTFHDCMTIADGKVYVATGEHSPNDPLYRGEKLHCFDAQTGKGIWNISCWAIPPVVAEGYAVTQNVYDNRLYCYGKGKSATTVSAPTTVVAKGSKVLIQGTVTDQSPAQPGTPCVSKESMSAWMGYLHMQKLMPSKVTGVPVQLLAVKADGSMVDLGTVTSDTGGFRKEWTPPDEGLYTITANFAGDDSYGSSYATTGLSVGPAPEPVEIPPVEIPAQPDYTPIFAGLGVAIVAVAALVVYNILSVRKLRR